MNKMVLVVEDDFDTLNPLAELLRLNGYTVITASDAERALILARERRPDLIITDIVLPGRSGLHFIRDVRGDRVIKATPIIVISGCGQDRLAEAKSIGANRCLEKPIDIEQLWDSIESVMGSVPNTAANARAETRDIEGQARASEIDRLVEKLRQSDSGDEKEDTLKRLKEQILHLQARSS